MGVSLCSLHVPSGFGGRAGSDMHVSYVFTQGALTAITMVGGGAGDRGARIRAKCELGLLPGSAVITAVIWVWSGPKLLDPKP